MEEQEEWKTVIGFPNYQVSSLGRVRSINFNKTGKVKLMSDKCDIYGYKNVHLWNREVDNTKPKPFRTNRLVALHFIPNPENKEFVNHLDSDRGNNYVSNLEWATHRENVTHSYQNNLGKPQKKTGVFRKKNYYESGTIITDKWYACIRVNNKLIHLGTRNNEQEAHELYLKALVDYGLMNNYAAK